MTVGDSKYSEKIKAGEMLISKIKESGKLKEVYIGEYIGFKLKSEFNAFTSMYNLIISNNSSYKIDVGSDPIGNITRIENAIQGIEKKIEVAKLELQDIKNQLENAKMELDSEFKFESELKEKSRRLDEVNALLKINGKENEILESDVENEKEFIMEKFMEKNL